jgi:hypothetical protein
MQKEKKERRHVKGERLLNRIPLLGGVRGGFKLLSWLFSEITVLLCEELRVTC